jgi:hypothetical protein
LWTAAVLLTAWAPPTLSQPGRDQKLDAMPRSLEIRFALSALPPALRAKAAVYVLDPARGYVLAVAGSNGQSCLVERTVWPHEQYRDDHYAAICYDAAGAKSNMRFLFDVAELRAKGLTGKAMVEEIRRRFAAGVYAPPARAGVAYMAAPLMRTYATPDPHNNAIMTMVMPHVMYYAPNVTDAQIGGAPPPPVSPYPFVLEQGPLGYIVQLFGEHEAAQIVSREADLLRDLCAYRNYLCVRTTEALGPHRDGPAVASMTH